MCIDLLTISSNLAFGISRFHKAVKLTIQHLCVSGCLLLTFDTSLHLTQQPCTNRSSYTYMCTYIHTQIHICICTNMYIQIHIYIYI